MRQKDSEFKAILGYTVRYCLRTKEKKDQLKKNKKILWKHRKTDYV